MSKQSSTRSLLAKSKLSSSSSSSSSSDKKDKDVHRWSGWPGAYCLDCKIEDQREICIADGHEDGCSLPKCHNPLECVIRVDESKLPAFAYETNHYYAAHGYMLPPNGFKTNITEHEKSQWFKACIRSRENETMLPDTAWKSIEGTGSMLLPSADESTAGKGSLKKRPRSKRILKSLPPAKRRKDTDEKNIYTVSEIRLMTPDGTECFVHWDNTTEKDNSWIPTSDILDSQLIADYKEQKNWKFQYASKKDGWKDVDDSVQETIEKQFQQWLELSTDLSKAKNVLFHIRNFEYVLTLSRYIGWDQENCTHPNHTVRSVRRVPAK